MQTSNQLDQKLIKKKVFFLASTLLNLKGIRTYWGSQHNWVLHAALNRKTGGSSPSGPSFFGGCKLIKVLIAVSFFVVVEREMIPPFDCSRKGKLCSYHSLCINEEIQQLNLQRTTTTTKKLFMVKSDLLIACFRYVKLSIKNKLFAFAAPHGTLAGGLIVDAQRLVVAFTFLLLCA